MFKIRPICPSDDFSLACIIRDSLAANDLAIPGTAYFDPELNNLSKFYSISPKRKYFVVISETGTVLGGAGIAEFAGSYDCAELQKLYLADSAKGHQLGYALIKTVEAFAIKSGYKKLYLETHHSLSAAIHIYEKAGFKKLYKPLPGSIHSSMDIFFIKSIH